MTTFFLARDVISYAVHRFISASTVTSGEELACFANLQHIKLQEYVQCISIYER